ncbi:hypothetical protein [Rhodococcus sp. H29-C3]|uniref:hypothetical protein n=1 Tax=Rhodococcus sp. H29-C3 TaxID=3046307 RepID=UPI0024B8A377|nr:hypothetical protein [Rhodococcus sp. H29-C3]MDJ0362419.1 hypothetical protein [Rhodococcus sp. H29-C3]
MSWVLWHRACYQRSSLPTYTRRWTPAAASGSLALRANDVALFTPILGLDVSAGRLFPAQNSTPLVSVDDAVAIPVL